MTRTLTLALLLLVAASAPVAADVVIPASASAGSPLAQPGTGLAGSFWDLPEDSAHWPRTNAFAKNVISSQAPTSTFVATLLDYDHYGTLGDATPLSLFLGADGATLQGPDALLGNGVFCFRGFLKVTPDMDSDTADGQSDIDVVFALNSDDGSYLAVAGLIVVDYEGYHQAVAPVFGKASFEAEGMYPIELVYYNSWCYGWTGGAHLDWYSSILGGPVGGAPSGTAGIVPPSVLYAEPIPEPASLLSGMVGLGTLGAYLKRRARQVTCQS